MSVANPIQGYIVPRLQIANMTADQIHTQSDTSLENVTELVLPVSANTRYYLEEYLRMTCPTTENVDFTFEAIANTAYAHFSQETRIANGVAFGTEQNQDTDGALQTLKLSGLFKTGSTAGNLQFQFAQEISGATNTTLNEGSCLLLYTLD